MIFLLPCPNINYSYLRLHFQLENIVLAQEAKIVIKNVEFGVFAKGVSER